MLRPIGDRVLVKPDATERKVGSIILPDQFDEKPRTGYVLAVGTGNIAIDSGERTAPDVQVGDHVLFSHYGGVEAKIAGETYLLLREPDIMGVLDDAEIAVKEAAAAAARNQETEAALVEDRARLESRSA